MNPWLRSLSLWTALLLCSFNPQAAELMLKAGAAVVDISPTNFPVLVNAMFTERTATQTVDRLEARGLVLDDGSNRIALVVVDSCMVNRELIDRAKAEASAETGIRMDRILVSSTHTHSAPSAMGCLGSRVDTNYAAFLPGRIAQAIVEANRSLVPARIGWTVTNDWDHTFTRRWIRRPDQMLQDPFGEGNVRANMHPGYQSADAIGPSGPVDPALSIVSVQTREGRPLALLANYSQHYYGSPLVSSDYYGKFRLEIGRLLGATNAARPFVAIMSQGTSGDQMWMDYGAPAKEIGYEAYAKEIAARVHEALGGIRYADWVPLRMAQRTLQLRYRAPTPARLAWARETARALGDRLPQTQPEIYALEAIYLHERPETELILQALRIGELGIAAIPNEVYALTGLKLKAQSPLQPTINMELANGAEGYIPPPEQHKLGGYTTWAARTAGLEEQAEPRIVEALLGLLEEVSGQERRPLEVSHGPYARRVFASKPRAYWRFEEMNVPVAHDASASHIHGTFEEGVALHLPGPGSGEGVSPHPNLQPSRFSGSSAINRAVHFAGGRMKAEVALGKTFSVELWFWNGLDPSARSVTGYFFSRGNPADPEINGDHLGIAGTRAPEETGRLIYSNGNKRPQTLMGRTPLTTRTWHHVVLVRDGSWVSAYLDGQLEFSGEAEPSAMSASIFVGGRSDGFCNFEGKLDEVAAYDRALTAAEVAEHWAAAGLASAKALVTAAPDETDRISVHFNRTNGVFRALHGVNKGPLAQGGLIDLTEAYRELAIPLVRLHDCQWPYPDVVDVHAIFRNPAADPEKPESYDFALTDDYLSAVHQTGAKIVYRLGESIEHGRVKRFVHPPKDAEHWAAVCRGILRHYNEGWAKGFHYGIDYVEIWNEPENRPAMWSGSDEDFLRLYGVAARSLKAEFPRLKVGGPAFGFSGRLVEGDLQPSEFVLKFLEFCRKERAPLDFFSWHCYTAEVEELVARAKGVRALLDRMGFGSTESHLNEWNYLPDNSWNAFSKTATPGLRREFFERMTSMEGGSFLAAALSRLQDAPLDQACLFHGEIGVFGLFDQFGAETRALEALRLYRRFLQIASARVEVQGSVRSGTSLIAGKGEGGAAVLVAHSGGTQESLNLQLEGLNALGKARLKIVTLREEGLAQQEVNGSDLRLDLEPRTVVLVEVLR